MGPPNETQPSFKNVRPTSESAPRRAEPGFALWAEVDWVDAGSNAY